MEKVGVHKFPTATSKNLYLSQSEKELCKTLKYCAPFVSANEQSKSLLCTHTSLDSKKNQPQQSRNNDEHLPFNPQTIKNNLRFIMTSHYFKMELKYTVS